MNVVLTILRGKKKKPLRVFVKIEMLLEDSIEAERVLEESQSSCLSSQVARDSSYLCPGHLAAQFR